MIEAIDIRPTWEGEIKGRGKVVCCALPAPTANKELNALYMGKTSILRDQHYTIIGIEMMGASDRIVTETAFLLKPIS